MQYDPATQASRTQALCMGQSSAYTSCQSSVQDVLLSQILAYLHAFADEYGLRRNILFNTRVVDVKPAQASATGAHCAYLHGLSSPGSFA